MRRALVIFARGPEREALAKRLPLESAAPLFRRLLRSWIAAAQQHDATPIVACSDVDRSAFAGQAIVTQRGDRFGIRVANAVADAFALGFTSVAIACIDAPPPNLGAVFAAIEQGSAVIAPSRDGGVNLIGLAAPHRELLESIRPRERDLVSRCRAAFERLVIVEGARDVDDTASMQLSGTITIPHPAPCAITLRGTRRNVPPRAPPVAA